MRSAPTNNFLSSTADVVGRTRAVHKTADEQAISVTALQDDEHLALSMATNAVHALDMYVDADADRGVVRTSGTAGTLRLRWAQTVLSATPTILRAGSWLRLHRIA
ncbi:hypothetical protein ACFZAU_11450 [Streptomyces sp. NPDC008238]